MDVKYVPEDWEKTKEGIGELVGSGMFSRGAIDNLKKLDTIIEKATGSIMRNDEDKVVHLPYKSQKGKYQELQKDYNVLHDFSGKVGGLIDTEIDQPFYEDMDAFAEAMRDLTIDKYETSNTIGAKETIMTGSYGQTAEHIKDKIKVSDIFSSNNFFMTSLKAEFDAYKKENPKDNMSYETYQQRRLNSRAFNYDSIKDQQQNKEFWRDVGILGTTLLLAGATVFFPPAGAALFAFTASVGVMEVSSAATGKDWLTQRKLDTNERWLRGVLGFVDVAPVAKGLHAFGNVTTGLKSGVSTTTIKGASKVGLEEGGSRLKQADNLLTERAQNANRLSGKKFDNLSLNIEKKTPVENVPVIEKKSATFFDELNLKNGSKVAEDAKDNLLKANPVCKEFTKQIEVHPQKQAVEEVISYIIKKQNSVDSKLLLNPEAVNKILNNISPNTTRKEIEDLKWEILYNYSINENKRNLTPSQRARLWQGGSPYFGLDEYEDMVLKKGEIVYTGYPRPTGYSFTKETLESVGGDSKKLFQGVQVNPRLSPDGTGEYKFQVIGFEMLDDLPSARGMTHANPQLGAGGLEQIFTPEFTQLVREGKAKPILDEQTMARLREKGIEFDPKLLQQVDKDGKYVYNSICDIFEVLIDDPNIVKLNNYKLGVDEIDDINDAIREISNTGGGIN
ncbi:pre-toxin TG domain-containing protein [Bacillus mycoides]|uniref:pre-toxin TG domain-containing protein n=2 Tax=Bacillus mycoides TaxID=1405 RepID=UPI000697EA92|nr:pre-toxin TG domain-containing protein [Bacillus mycoides]MED1431013.1 hypothetical protein [Bacillus mycoides]MED1487356.1 hypothetical protein [Bacillus mycoides]